MRLARLTVALLVGFGLWVAVPSGQQPAPRPRWVEGELLVKFRPSAPPDRRGAVLGAIRGQRIRRFASLDIDHVRLPRGQRTEDAMAVLAANPDVAEVQPNYVRTMVAVTPNDTYWGYLWGMVKIQAPDAWTYTTGSTAVIVADIDTGVRYTHPDLTPNMWRNPGEIAANGIDDDANGYVDDVYGIDVINNDSNPLDDNGHGTHTAGTIGAVGNNARGVTGLNWNVKILACKFLAANGSGYDSGAIECLEYVTALKNRGENIRITNNSWGGERGGGPVPQLLKDAFDAAGNAGILNIAAAGNGGVDDIGDDIDLYPHDPASLTSPSIVSVAASDQNDARASFSNYGATSVDLAAPGVDILSTYWTPPGPQPSGNVYAWANGTSMAAPHVAGVAALLLAQNPDVPVAGLKQLLLSNVTPVGSWAGVVATGGRLNAYLAAQALAANTPPTVSLTSPANASVHTAPATLTLAATAGDTGGVARVDFLSNGVVIGTDDTSPYSVTVTGVPGGVHDITAEAVDAIGASTTSGAARVFVVTPGVVDEASVGAAVARGGSRLQALQNGDGGWFFRAGDTGCNGVPGVSCVNTVGVTALGLLSEHARTGEPSALADAVEAGDALVAKFDAAILQSPPGLPKFQDLEFLVALTAATGNALYTATATQWFQVVVAQYPNAADRVDFYMALRDSAHMRTVAAWDTASFIRTAKAVGSADYALAAATRIVQREAEWKDVDPAHRFDQCATPSGCGPANNPLAFDYTLMGMGSLLWAFHDLPGFDAKIAEYRAHLLAQQDPSGSWDVGDSQITAYVVLGLAAVGGAGTDAAITAATGFFHANQLANGGWPAYVTNGLVGAEYPEVNAEVTRAVDTLFNTMAGEGVAVAPAQLATVTFNEVLSPGGTTVVALDTSASARVSGGFSVVGGLTYEVSTTASVSGDITVCFAVPWASTLEDFSRVRVLHGEGGVLKDRTILSGPLAPSIATHRVCALVTSLSPFAVAVRHGNGPPSGRGPRHRRPDIPDRPAQVSGGREPHRR